MLLNLLSLFMLTVYGWGTNPPKVSKRPALRPNNLQIIDRPELGEERNGRVTLRIVFPNDGLYYQRDNRTHNIPIMHYFKNEYPDLDFSQFKINRMSINSRGLSDTAYIGIHNQRGRRVFKANIPIVAYPGEPLGEYSQTIVEENKLRTTFSYISVKGVIGINNITLEMERGRPNFTFDTSNFSVQGKQVNPISGYIRAEFVESRFLAIMKEVNKMGTIIDPNEIIEEEFVEDDIDQNDIIADTDNGDSASVWDNDDLWDDEWSDSTDTEFPLIVEDDSNDILFDSDLFRFPQRTISIGRLKSRGGIVRIERLSGSAVFSGFEVTYRDGRQFFQNYDIPVNDTRTMIDLKLNRSFSYSTITLYFRNVSRDGEVFLDWWEL